MSQTYHFDEDSFIDDENDRRIFSSNTTSCHYEDSPYGEPSDDFEEYDYSDY